MNMTSVSTLESDIRELMKEIPPQVRALFASGKVETIAKNLMQKNQLHIDQGAVVEREIILLLLGLKSPEEFTQTLTSEANLNQQVINGIMQDINAQIFMPLREEMRKAAGSVTQSPKPMMPPPQSPSYFHLENKLPPINPIRPSPPAPSRQPPASRLLEDHEEPHIELGIRDKVQVASTPTNEPTASAQLKPSTLPLTPTPPAPPPAPVKPYPIDPYREPIE